MLPLILVTIAVFGIIIAGSLRNRSARSDRERDLKARIAKSTLAE